MAAVGPMIVAAAVGRTAGDRLDLDRGLARKVAAAAYAMDKEGGCLHHADGAAVAVVAAAVVPVARVVGLLDDDEDT